jgi:hypothetical protein
MRVRFVGLHPRFRRDGGAAGGCVVQLSKKGLQDGDLVLDLTSHLAIEGDGLSHDLPPANVGDPALGLGSQLGQPILGLQDDSDALEIQTHDIAEFEDPK